MEGMMRKVLILGGSGAFGSSVAAAFWNADWAVEVYARGTDMTAAARGMDVIVNGLNPARAAAPARAAHEMTIAVLAAAQASGARVILPGRVDLYGTACSPWGPATPHHPVTRAGTIQVQIEARYRASDVRTTILRSGEFLHEGLPHLAMNRIVLRALRRGRVTALGDPAVLRSHAYLPDLAEAVLRLADRGEALPDFAEFPFAGHLFSTVGLTRQLSHMLDRPLRTVPRGWWPVRRLAVVRAQARVQQEIRHLYNHPHWMEATTLAAVLPDLRATAFEVILSRHLAAMGLQGRATSTQTSRWREAISAVAAKGSSGAGQITPEAMTVRSREGST
jgi:dTDP-4-dehydrorhamnose reductase